MCLLFLRYLHNSLLNMLQNIALPTLILPTSGCKDGEDLLRNLPQEMMVDILSRLPIKTIMRCKSVCKSWHDLIEGSEFATTHLSKSSPSCLAVIPEFSKPYKICALVDDACCIRTKPVSIDFDFPRDCYTGTLVVHSSANGLLLLISLFGVQASSLNLLICNPMTREYMDLPPPPRNYKLTVFGFGASRVSGKYKIVMIFWELNCSDFESNEIKGEVYTLGTAEGLWRSININNAADHTPRLSCEEDGAFLNGNLHWLSSNLEGICCFDLETELFTSFSAPPPPPARRCEWLSVVEGRLCLCNVSDDDDERISIWFMNKYGDDKSWVKEFIINTLPPTSPRRSNYYRILPIKVFKDGGDILFALKGCANLFFYSNKTKAIQEYDPFQVGASHHSHTDKVVVYTPTFISLQTCMGIIQDCSVQMF